MKGNDVKRIAAKVESVHALQRMQLMQDFTPEPNVYVHRQCLQLQDKRYMKNWCDNVRMVWAISFPQSVKTEVKDIELTVFDKETGDLLCRYKNGEVLFV